MFIDLRELQAGKQLKFDLCILGAGAAGITLAKKLQNSGLNIALLESGGFSLEPDSVALTDGSTSGVPYMPLAATRLRQFGGTTGHWAGQSIPLDPLDFLPRSWIPHSGWPISYAELNRYTAEAADICGVPRGGFHWSDIDQAEKLHFPLTGGAFDDTLMRFSNPPRRFGEYFRDEIGGAKNITCLLHANVTEIVTNDAGNRVSHVKVASAPGREFNAHAQRFVLACGGVENARLMLASNRRNPKGLGNQNDQVGRYFMEHPNFDAGAIRVSNARKTQHLTSPWLRRGSDLVRLEFKLGAREQQRLGILNHTAFFVPSDTDRTHMSDEAGFLDKAWSRLESIYQRVFSEADVPVTEQEFKLRVRLEQAPTPQSRVTLSERRDAFDRPLANVNIELGKIEAKTIDVVMKALARQLGGSGLGRMRVDFAPSSDIWKTQVGWQVHHCGGTRMHASPDQGVVDSDCKVHGIDNLWIAGSSVFPSAGHANPTMNLVALTLRLADHLSGRQGVRK